MLEKMLSSLGSDAPNAPAPLYSDDMNMTSDSASSFKPIKYTFQVANLLLRLTRTFERLFNHLIVV